MKATLPVKRQTAVATTSAPDVSVVIVNYNVREFLEQALDSIELASTNLDVEVFVVDNNSADGSVQMVRERFPDVHLIENEENVGFATANNQALREANGRYLLILNPDTLVQEDTLEALVRFMDGHEQAGAVGCRILNPDGTFAPESRRAFPTPSVAFYRLTGLGRLFPKSPTFGKYNLTYLPIDEKCEVDALSGSCMMVRKRAVQQSFSGDRDGAGLFDESFFMYGEDLDWCYRIQQTGWKIYYTPDTQIIHYKGESTKKGELRYVRLFYGAMLRFVEKHFADNRETNLLRRVGSQILALCIRCGILVRALLSFFGQVLGSLRVPSVEFLTSYLVIALVAFVWASWRNVTFDLDYYGIVVPAYALATVFCIWAAGGYKRTHISRLRPVAVGILGSLVLIAALSFFVKDIAFSRATILFGFTATLGVLLGVRMGRRVRNKGMRKAVLVGSATEASRLQRLLNGSLSPKTHLLGYVGNGQSSDHRIDGKPAFLGQPRHLRDLVRLQQADDVVFASDSMTNTAILGHMRQLRDLPVQFKILASRRDLIIGKASVEDFSVPLVSAERAVAPLRSPTARRALDVSIALLGITAHPILRLLLTFSASAQLRRIAGATARMPSVLAGRRTLIGYDTTEPHPPADWGLTPGVVSILDTLSERPASIVEAHRAYWFYARNQSLGLDLEILLRALFSRQ